MVAPQKIVLLIKERILILCFADFKFQNNQLYNIYSMRTPL